MKPRKSHGDFRVKPIMLKNTVSQNIYKLNNNTGEVSINYKWKVLRCIISRTMKLLDNSIHNMHFINTLVKTTCRNHLIHILT